MINTLYRKSPCYYKTAGGFFSLLKEFGYIFSRAVLFYRQPKLLRVHFIDSIFEFIRQNNENYRLLCRSNDFLFAAKKLTAIASGKLLELCLNDNRIKKKECIELDLQIFLEGLFCEYVKYCRGYSDKTLDDLYEYTKYWVTAFFKQRA